MRCTAFITKHGPKRVARAGARSLLLLAVALGCAGCPIAIADPYTESRITNDTATAILVELVLDEGGNDTEPAPDDVRRRLEEFAMGGDGVEVVALEPHSVTGRYRIQPSGYMIVHASLGTSPSLDFNEMSITSGDRTVQFSHEGEIVNLFVNTVGYFYELRVSEINP